MPVPTPSVPRRRWIPLVAVATLLAGLVGPIAPAAPAGWAAPPTAGLDESAARRAAVRSGQRVEVGALTTPTRQVYANPDGTFTAQVHALPVRVRDRNGWRGVDTTLRRTADGRVAPVAASLEMSFSGGGTAPLVRLRSGDRELALTWPGRLPAPTLTGDTATYRDVLPGVDLTLRADVEGFAPALVVRTAQAARNPALGTLRLGARTTGLVLRAAPAGGLTALAPDGTAVFQAVAPAGAAAAADRDPAADRGAAALARPAGSDRMSRVVVSGARIEPDGLALTLDRSTLTAPDAAYPLLAEPPAWTGARTAWTQVWSNYPTTSFYNGANLGSSEKVARVGYDATDGKQTRSFFRFDTSGVKGKRIVKATLQTYETWSRSCTARQVEAWETGDISSSTTWKAQPAWISRLAYVSVAKGYSSSCPAGGVEFDVTAHVTKAAANGANSITQGLRASQSAEKNKDTLSWKKFRNNPSLTIVYNSAPGTPTNLTTEGSAVCTTGDGRLLIGRTTPTLRATVKDPDNAVTARFEWWTLDGTAPLGTYVSPSVAGGTPTTVAATIPEGHFANGAIGRWRVRAEDGLDMSAWSDWCEFQIDTSRPPIPTVSSAAFPDNGSGTAVMGDPVSVTFGANGGDTVARYEYVLNGDATSLSGTAQPAQTGGAATVALVPDRYVNWIHVRAVNTAGNRSEVATVVFYAAPPAGPVGEWSLDETGDGTVAVDSSPAGRHAPLSGGASWGDGRYSGALHLDGVDGYAATAGPVLDTTRSLSVSAWVRLIDGSRNSVVLAQVGNRASAITLYYSASYNRWIFNRTTVDGDSPTYVRAISTSAPVLGVWTHLIGVYDAAAGQIRLYVNGLLQGETAFTAQPWAATGPLQIGRSKVGGVFGEYWPGQIDEVAVYDRPLLPGEIQQVSRPEGRWELDETSGATGADALGRHPVTLSGGVARTAGVRGNALQFSGGTAVTAGPVVRTDSSYTVAAWLRPGPVGRNEVAVSQDGTQVSGFNLGYSLDPDTGGYRWSVRVPTADSLSATVVTAVDLFAPPTTGVWTHLAAVYDAKDQRIRLYVDGQIAGEAAYTGVVNATGPLRLGAGRLPGSTAPEEFSGAVDEVQAISGVLTDQEIYGLYADVAVPVPTESSFWPGDVIPRHEVVPETEPVDLGLRFTTSRAGSIVGLRFLKGAGDTGRHTLTLWDGTGAVLARVTPTTETASGWQEVRLDEPVPVEPGRTYVVSYHTSSGRFTVMRKYFTGSPFVAGPLIALAAPNGVYAYSATPAFPTGVTAGANYFADVIFS